jgi:hypothetical protein
MSSLTTQVYPYDDAEADAGHEDQFRYLDCTSSGIWTAALDTMLNPVIELFISWAIMFI